MLIEHDNVSTMLFSGTFGLSPHRKEVSPCRQFLPDAEKPVLALPFPLHSTPVVMYGHLSHRSQPCPSLQHAPTPSSSLSSFPSVPAFDSTYSYINQSSTMQHFLISFLAITSAATLSSAVPILSIAPSPQSILTARPLPTRRETQLPYGKVIDRCIVSGTIALAFDDGPYIYTEHVLDLFAEADVHATFFLNGDWKGNIYDYSHVMNRTLAEGHQIGSHSYGLPVPPFVFGTNISFLRPFISFLFSYSFLLTLPVCLL